jgi:paraquat-inducible protein B
MVDDAKFWVVRPTISLSGVSGLSTLLSGNYIGFEPGTSGNRQDVFTGLDVAPVITEERGAQFVLKASDLGSLDIGSPVYYRRLPVGQVVAYDLAPDGETVQVRIFVKAPYDTYVYPETRFWNASGIEISAGADGVNVRTESLVALLIGGLAFDIPSFEPRSGLAAPNTVFTLYSNRTVAMKAPDAIARRYVLHFKESLRGLAVGAPVTFLGLPAGEVSSVGLEFDAAKANVQPRVVITFFPERLLAYANAKADARGLASALQDEQKRRAFLRRLVEDRGLRGQLKSGSLLTGQLYVAFDYYPKAPKVKVDLSQELPELPVVPGTLADLEDKLGSIVDKIDKMPLEAIGNNLKKDLENLDQTLTGARKLLSDADVGTSWQARKARRERARAEQRFEDVRQLANATLLESNSAAQEDLRNALSEFTRAARSLRVLTDELERQPSSLIRGKTEPWRG